MNVLRRANIYCANCTQIIGEGDVHGEPVYCRACFEDKSNHIKVIEPYHCRVCQKMHFKSEYIFKIHQRFADIVKSNGDHRRP